MKREKKVINRYTAVNDMVYGRGYIVLSVLALSALISPYIFLFTSKSIPYPVLSSIFTPVIFISLGYLIQGMFGKLFRYKRAREDNAFEQTEKMLDWAFALPSLIISAVLLFASNKLISSVLTAIGKAEHSYYDKYTVVPFILSAFITLCFIAGVAAWFFPFTRIISYRNIISLCMAFIINMLATLIYSSGTTLMYCTVCLFVFLCISFILLNQSSVIFTYSKTKYRYVSNGSRLYNVAVVILLMLVLVVAVVGVLSVLTGVTISVKAVILYLVQIARNDDEELQYEEADEIAHSFSKSVFSGVIDPVDAGYGAKVFFMIFFLLVMAVAAFFIIARRRDVWEKIKKAVNSVADFIMSFLSALFAYHKEEKMYIIPDFLDEEIKMDKDAVRDFEEEKSEKRTDYRRYILHLASINDKNERVRYSYRTLVSAWREQKYGLSLSDTPSEILQKVSAFYQKDDVKAITELFEKLEYAGESRDDGLCDKMVDYMGGLIKRFG